MTIVHGVRTGAVSRFVTRFTPWVLLILPVLVSETVEAGMYLAGRLVIGDCCRWKIASSRSLCFSWG